MSHPKRVAILSAIVALCAADAAPQTTRAADPPVHATLPGPPVAASSARVQVTRKTGADKLSTDANVAPEARSDNGAELTAKADTKPTFAATPTGTTSTAAKPAGDSAKPAKSPPAGAPQVPEESASVRDDPTIAPDAKQSADNNVSFPNDI